MKKFLLSLALVLVLAGLSAAKETPEVSLVKWNSGASGNVLLTIAEKKGYFDEVGIKLEEVPATANASAMTLLST